jgi:hypothetical protein
MRRLKQWLRTLWTGTPLPRAVPRPPQTCADLEELKRLIETADPRDPQILEQIAARLGQTDPSAFRDAANRSSSHAASKNDPT